MPKFSELDLDGVRDLIRAHNEISLYVVIDLETTGLNPRTDSIINVVISGISEDRAYLCPPLAVGLLLELRKPIVCHNFKFDFNFCYQQGIDLRSVGLHADTMLLDHLLDENLEHSLDAIIKRRYNDSYKEEFWERYKTYEDAPHDARLKYACSDVLYTRRVLSDTLRDLSDCGVPTSLVNHVHNLALALYSTELVGIRLDLSYLEKMGQHLQEKISNLKLSMREMVDLECLTLENNDYLEAISERKTPRGKAAVKREEFNFDSTQQLGRLLYDSLKLPVQLSKTKSRTVDDAALETLKLRHPLIPLIRDYRGYRKTFTAFIEGSLEKMHEGRIHPSFNVNGTVTGRISSSSPNMQQLPKEGGIRGIYIPDAGYQFISCDFSQLEVTLAAHFSRDRNLLKIVYEGASQHDITALGLGISRTTAKTINFALQYGAGARKIQQILSCTQEDAEDALRKYWETYCGLRDFIRQCHAKVERGTPLVNPFGRQRRFNIKGANHWEKERAKRQAANALIQGTGADITNRAFYLVGQTLLDQGLGKALFPIHDEILIMVKDEHAEEARALLQKQMIDVGVEIGLSVPLSVECSKPMYRWEKS